MNPKELENSYQKRKHIFYKYINDVKTNSKKDIHIVINPTLIKNPYVSSFPLRFFKNDNNTSNKTLLFLKSVFKFYIKNIYLLFSYITACVLCKLYYKKNTKNELKHIIDVYGLVDNVNKQKEFSENYLTGIYEIFKKYNIPYTILLRPYEVGKNPFKLKQFFQILNKDKKDFIFEYELLSFFDFLKIMGMTFIYPFTVLRLIQKEVNEIDVKFNISLIEDINYFSFESITRYILGENLSKIKSVEKIYSWSEFQVIERSFNYAIRSNCKHIKLIGLQFFLNYETYFNTYADDIDYDMLSSPHKMLVNGKYYVQDKEKIKYDTGVSLRYKNMFNFDGIKEEKNILLLGSYIESDTKYMLESVKEFDNVIFKNHPAVDIQKFGKLPENITVSNNNIYELFENTKLVIGTASGTAVEAVACRISVIIIASQDNLTANPLVDYGKREIWDIAFDISEVKNMYTKLLDYRVNNQKEIIQIASWYKEHFFIEPTKKNIVKVFDVINKERDKQ